MDTSRTDMRILEDVSPRSEQESLLTVPERVAGAIVCKEDASAAPGANSRTIFNEDNENMSEGALSLEVLFA